MALGLGSWLMACWFPLLALQLFAQGGIFQFAAVLAAAPD